MGKILDHSLTESGFLSPVMDCLNDMAQHCDHERLGNELYHLCSSVVKQLSESVAAEGNPQGYSSEEKETLVNNLGGLLQILVVRLQGTLTGGDLVNEIF
jgi:hypothetical protein